MKLPVLSSKITREQMKKHVSRLRICAKCRHVFFAGDTCSWCSVRGNLMEVNVQDHLIVRDLIDIKLYEK